MSEQNLSERLRVFLRSLSTAELQRRIVEGNQKIGDRQSSIIELGRRNEIDDTDVKIVKEIVEERYKTEKHTPELLY